MFSQILKGRHYICQLLFSWVFILTLYFPQPTLDLCLLGFLLFQSWANNALGSAFVVVLFLYCTATPALKHHFNLRRIQRTCSPFVPLPSAQWHQRTCQLHFLVFFLLRGGTDWPCKNDTMAMCAERSSSMELAFGLQQLETQSCAIKLSVWKLYICFKLWMNAK